MSKICGICSEDCSDRPRVKDQKGRYYCKTCVTEHEKRAAAAALAPATTAAVPADDEPFRLDDDQAFELADNKPGGDPMPIEMLDRAEKIKGCPVCMHTLAPGAKICISCGYDMDKGIQSSTHIERSASKKHKGKRGYLCANCGYDLEGLRDPVCPECGTRVNISRRAKLDADIKSQVFHEEYKKPLVWFAVGFVVVGIALAIKGEPMGFAGYAILLALQLPFMLIGLWLCQLTFLGEMGNIPLNTVRIASALALGNAVDEIVPIAFFFITPGTLVYVGVLMDLFDIDISDAVGVAIVMFVTKVIATFVAIFALVQYFGLTL